MEERYEIRGTIGHGGLGSVYRGYDTRMKREVAIKRIAATAAGAGLEAESNRQLLEEAGALASLQHPHIVTIHDVGSDAAGPYVVMELIAGKTLDELVERAPLTWPDFRELALQTQEALIAAQELDLVHGDLKPGNVMLAWLPSGKFQVKIVDFGLATYARTRSDPAPEALEEVFGSVHFMPLEQFERVPLDGRSDLYSMGCVYYHALTGAHPFDGGTGAEVMESHLHHRVTPVQDLRSDIPLWACEWVMWHLNRLPRDRPASARQALAVFLQNDKVPDPTVSLGRPQAGLAGHPRLIRPGLPAPDPTGPLTRSAAKTKSAPQPLTPPEGSKPSVHIPPHVEGPEPLIPPQPVPVPLRRPAGFPAAALKVAARPAGSATGAPTARKHHFPRPLVVAMVLAVALVLAAAVLGWMLMAR